MPLLMPSPPGIDERARARGTGVRLDGKDRPSDQDRVVARPTGGAGRGERGDQRRHGDGKGGAEDERATWGRRPGHG